MMSSITYGIVTFSIDGVTSFLQLLDVQNVHKILVSVLRRVAGNSDSLFKMAESIYYEGFVRIFKFCVC